VCVCVCVCGRKEESEHLDIVMSYNSFAVVVEADNRKSFSLNFVSINFYL
jgi:hypothetical protein